MIARKLVPIAAAAAFLAACEARVGKNAETADAGNAAAATAIAGKSEEGTFSIDAPGFDMKIAIPKAMQDQVDSDSDIIPPGATFRGIHIQGNEGEAQSGVELRFSDLRPPEELANWYRGGDAGREFTVASAERRGDAFVIAGQTRQDGDSFTVHLSPRAGGGTDARLVIADSGR